MRRRRYRPGCTECGDTGAVIVETRVLPGVMAGRSVAWRTVDVVYRCACGAGSRYPSLPLTPRAKRLDDMEVSA